MKKHKPVRKPGNSTKVKNSQRSSPLDTAWEHHKAGRLEQAEKMYRAFLRKHAGNAEALRLLGNVLNRTGRAGEAVDLLTKALRIRPNNAAVCQELGIAYTENGRLQEAVDIFKKAIELDPKISVLYARLAQIYMNQFDTVSALAVLNAAVIAIPDDPRLHKAMGDAYTTHGSHTQALKHYEISLQANPQSPEALCDIGSTLRITGQLDKAIQYYEQAIALKRDSPRAISGQAEILESNDKTDEAMAVVDKAIKRGVRHPDLAITFARLAKKTKRLTEGIELLKKVLADPGLPRPFRAVILMDIGGLLEADGSYTEAFDAYLQGNSLYPAQFDEKQYTQSMDVLLEAFNKDIFSKLPGSSIDTHKPIFILGMPRSGTSLIEQILASHSRVYGAGELTYIPEITQNLHKSLDTDKIFPRCINQLNQNVLNNQAQVYIDRINNIDPRAERVTDKLPANYLYLGLIRLLLPQSKIIHCVRNPVDTCLSCFATRLSPAHVYANNLQHTAIAYTQYRRVMKHWQETLNFPMQDIHYEEVVANPQASIEKLLQFCNLDWEDDCLHFHKSIRHTRTASIDQVRQPIYQSSVNRHSKFSSPLIEELKDSLALFL